MNNLIYKLLRFTVFFIVFSVFINLIYLLIIRTTDWDFIKRYEALKLRNPDYDLLVLGNSLPEYGIDTEFLTNKGIKSYNLSIIGNSDETSYLQLCEYMSSYSHKPRVVLFCVAAFSDAFHNAGVHPIVEFSARGHKYTWKDIPLLKFRWFGVEFLKKVFSSTHRKTKVLYGQIKSPKIITDYSAPNDTAKLDIESISSSLWIGKIAQLCSDNNITLIVIEMPGVKETQNLKEVGPYPLNFGNGASADLYNFNCRNFCSVFDNHVDWCGMSHLNQYGARKFTQEVFNILPLQAKLY